jgi:hypothetical protein
MKRELDRLMIHTLGLLALTGCGEKDTGDTASVTDPKYDGNYGTCDPEEIDDLPTEMEGLDGGETAEMLACDSGLISSEAECWDWEGQPSTLFSGDVGEDNRAVELVCGYMWLDGECCAHVVVQGNSDTDVGRPFLVHGAARKAGLAPRMDWAQPTQARAVPEALREALIRYWARAGLAEHASVAAFARFSMALMHLGAPPELVVEAHQAALDEVRHAQLCFGLASRYAGSAIGPGPLDVDASLEGELEPERVFETLFEEGCVGETLAALEAAQAARRAEDPRVREVMETIAADEQRHAELAWRSARWLLVRHPQLQLTLNRLAAGLVPPPLGDAPDALAEHGCLGAAERQRVKVLGLREVVMPLVRGLQGVGEGVAAEA